MSIEQSYLDKIEEIKQNADDLSDWERGFVFGEGENSPIAERPELSVKQKDIIDRIYNERVQGGPRQDDAPVTFGNDRVRGQAAEGTKDFRVVVDDFQVGPVVKRAEAVVIVGWLSSVMSAGHLDIAIPPPTNDKSEPSEDTPAGFPGEE